MTDEPRDTLLFDADFVRELERLELIARKIFRGLVRGEHHTKRRGRGMEFEDYRRYQPGDDLRYIDWNIYSRLENLVVKLFASEEDITLNILIDCSASMGFGEPLKFDYARKLTAALGFIGLNNLDRVSITAFSSDVRGVLPTLKSKRQTSVLLKHLSSLACAGETYFAQTMTNFTHRTPKPGLTIVITDLVDTKQLTLGLDALRFSAHDLCLIQLLSEEEIAPPLNGAWRLFDSENEQAVTVTLDPRLRQLYQDKLNEQLSATETYCAKNGIEYLRASTAFDFADLMLRYLRATSQWK